MALKSGPCGRCVGLTRGETPSQPRNCENPCHLGLDQTVARGPRTRFDTHVGARSERSTFGYLSLEIHAIAHRVIRDNA
eukprot:6322918-Prymnesium_polylepis.1